jgi:hypothetical protein
MALDIQAGDFLVVSSVEYPIRAVELWNAHGFGSSKAYALMATISCSTKRSPTVSSNKRGAPAAKLSGLYCTQLDRVQPELTAQVPAATPYDTLQTFISDGTDYARLILDNRRV